MLKELAGEQKTGGRPRGGTLCSCKATEITLIKCGKAIKALVWIVVLFLTFSFMCVSVCVCCWRPISMQPYLWPRPCGPHRGTAVSVAGLPPSRCRLGTARVSQVVYVGLAAPPDTADLPRLLPSSAAPAAHPPLAHRPAGMTQEKRGWVNRKLLNRSL